MLSQNEWIPYTDVMGIESSCDSSPWKSLPLHRLMRFDVLKDIHVIVRNQKVPVEKKKENSTVNLSLRNLLYVLLELLG